MCSLCTRLVPTIANAASKRTCCMTCLWNSTVFVTLCYCTPVSHKGNVRYGLRRARLPGTTTKQSTLSAWLGITTKKRPTNPLQKVQSNIRSFFGGGAESSSPVQLESASACKLNKKPRVDAPRARAPAWRQERQAGTCPAYKWVRGTNITVDAFKYGSIKVRRLILMQETSPVVRRCRLPILLVGYSKACW